MAITINHQTNDVSATGAGSITIDGATPGASTTLGAVGTYIIAGGGESANYDAGDTVSGSTLREFPTSNHLAAKVAYNQTTAFGLSGTWRYMISHSFPGTSYSTNGLWVRIS